MTPPTPPAANRTPPSALPRAAFSALLLASVLGLAPMALAQNTDAPKPADSSGAPSDESAERDALRDRLTRQLDFLKDREQQLEAALKSLDEGKPLDEVREDAAPDRGEIGDRIRDRFGERGPRGGDRARGPGRGGPGAGMGPGPGAGPGPEGDRSALGPDDVPRVMDFIERHNPELAKDLHDLSEKDPEAFGAKLAEIAPRLEGVMRRFEDRPERFQAMLEFRETDKRAHRLARAIAEDDTKAAELTDELRDAVGQGFDQRVKLSLFEIQDLHDRIEALEKRMSRWANERESMIDTRVKELIEGAASGEFPPPGDDEMDPFPPDRGPRRGPPHGPPPGPGAGQPGRGN